MPFLISESAAPLLMETVPVLKIRHFCGSPLRDAVYAYLRAYVHKGALHLCFTGFDGTPPPDTRFGLALQRADCLDKYLFVCTGPEPGTLSLTLRCAYTDAVLETLQGLSPPVCTQGADEQGWYWSVQTVVPKKAFCQIFGTPPAAGSVYAGNAFLYSLSEAAFGAAFPVPAGHTAPTCAGFDALTVVPY